MFHYAGHLIFPQISTILSNPAPPANPFPRPTCTPPSQIAALIRITTQLFLISGTVCDIVRLLSIAAEKGAPPLSATSLPSLPTTHQSESLSCLRRADAQFASRMGLRGVPTFRSKLYCSCGAKIPNRSGRSDVATFRRVDNPSISFFKPFRINTCKRCPIISALTPFRINTSGSVDSEALYPPLKSTLMKNRGGGIQLLLTRHATKHVYPERPSEVKNLSLTFQLSNLPR